MVQYRNYIHDLIYSNFDSHTLQSFFHEQFNSLQLNDRINSITFHNYTGLPLVISRKVYQAFTKDTNATTLARDNFIQGMTQLYSKSYSKRLEMIFSIIDYNRKGVVHIDDVKFFMLHFHLIGNDKSSKELLEQVELFFVDKKEVSLEEMLRLTMMDSSTIPLLLMFFFRQYLPVNESCIHYYEECRKEDRRKIMMNKNEAIKDDENDEFYYCQPCKFLYDYIHQNFNHDFGGCYIDTNEEENSELDELLTFEEDLSEIKSTIPENQGKSCLFLKSKNNLFSHTTTISTSTSISSYDCLIYKEKEPLIISNLIRHNSIKSDSGVSSINRQMKKCSSLCKLSNIPFIEKASFTGKCFLINSDLKIDTTYAIIENILFLTTNPKDSHQRASLIIPIRKLFLKSKNRTSQYNNHCITLISTLKGIIEKITISFTQRDHADDFIHSIETKANHRRLENDYDILETLGSGFSGVVKLVKKKKTNQLYALKIIPLHISQTPTRAENDDSIENDLRLAYNELDVCKVLMKISHENIVKVYDYFESCDKIFIVMEYLNGYTLDTIIDYKESDVQRNKLLLTSQLIDSLKVLNSYGIIHRDLKPENIIAMKDKGRYQVKIIDFGFSKVICREETIREFLGTLSFVSPEIVLEKDYSMNIDLWSLGVILYMILYKRLPFTHLGNGLNTIRENIITEQIKDGDDSNKNEEDEKIRQTMMMCLEKNNERRPSINVLCDLWNSL